MDYAAPRQNWTPGGTDEELLDWMTQQHAADPNWKIPNGYQLKDGRIQRDLGWQDSWLAKNFWWMPAAAAGGYALAGMGGGAPAAASATGEGAAAAGSGAGAAGAAGTAGAGGAAMGIGERVARAAVPAGLAIAGRVAGGGGNNGQIPPELRQILDLQRQRLQMQGPLYESILRLAQSRLPMSARSGPSLLPQTNPADALARLAGASPRNV